MLHDGTRVMTDSATVLKFTDEKWQHDMVNHSIGEYVRYEEGVCITTNTVESFFNILKRGLNGTYHHVSRRHSHRYLADFDFRYNSRDASDTDRALGALTGSGSCTGTHRPGRRNERAVSGSSRLIKTCGMMTCYGIGFGGRRFQRPALIVSGGGLEGYA